MIRFDTKSVEVYNGNLLIPVNSTIDLSEVECAMKNNKFIRIEISIPKENRSLSANAYCWVLCQKIAEELSKNDKVVKKEDVYRKAIKELFEPVVSPVQNEDVKDMKEAWESRGIGWICEDLGEGTLYGYTRLGFYIGSSRFDTRQMARLIDGLIQDAEALGLSIMSERDRQLLLEHWDKDRKRSE